MPFEQIKFYQTGTFTGEGDRTAREHLLALTDRDALERSGGVYTEAAKLLEVHPNYLHRLVNSLRLR